MSDTSGWGVWPDDGDPIGTASARLLAVGVDRRPRLSALRFLGLLLDHSDGDGDVRYDPSLLAGEFGIGPDAAREYVAMLEKAGVVLVSDDGLHVHGAEAHRPTGLRAGEAMAALALVLGSDDGAAGWDGATVPVPDDAMPDDAMPDVVPVPDAEPVPARAPAGPALPVALAVPAALSPGPRSPRRLARTGVGVLAGIALILAGLVVRPAPDTAERHEIASGEAASADIQVLGPGPARERLGAPPAPSSLPGSFSGTVGSPSGLAAPSAAVLAAPSADALLPDGGDVLAAHALCPSPLPSVTAVEATVLTASEVHLSAEVGEESPWRIVVQGEVAGGGEAASVASVPVLVRLADGQEVHGEAVSEPVTVPADGSLTWEAVLDPDVTVPPEVVDATAGPPVWRWVDGALATVCTNT